MLSGTAFCLCHDEFVRNYVYGFTKNCRVLLGPSVGRGKKRDDRARRTKKNKKQNTTNEERRKIRNNGGGD